MGSDPTRSGENGPVASDVAAPSDGEGGRLLWFAFQAAIGVCAVAYVIGTASAQARTPADDELARGRELFVTGCSSCHGLNGGGTARGPSLQDAGGASAYYYLVTGRMPAADSSGQPARKPPAYTPEQIERLVAYVASLGDGPPVPTVDPSRGDLARGGVLFRANCAACHNASGIGGALSFGASAPSLAAAEPTVVASAMRIGPGEMPVFGRQLFDDQDVNDIVRYVRFLQDPPDPGGAPLGRAGPIPEGFVAWVIGMGMLVVAVLWIGTRAPST